jgi:hypothetical protein
MSEAFSFRIPQPKTKPLLRDDMSHVVEWREYFRTGLSAKVPETEMAPADEVLHYFEPWEGDLKEVHTALDRPKWRRQRYDLEFTWTNTEIISAVMGYSFVSRARAVALASKADKDAYVAEVINQLRMGRLLATDCTYLIGLLVYATSDAWTLLSVQNCIPVLDFNDRQLLALQQQLNLIQMSDVKRTYRDEIAYDATLALNITPEQLKQMMEISAPGPFPRWPGGLREVVKKAYPVVMACRPEGWKFVDATMITEFLHDEVLPCVDDVAGTILVSRMAGLNAAEERLGESAGPFSICRIGGPISTVGILAMAARHQALAREAMLWCAIERFRLKNGSLPDTLDELVPDFVGKLPCDPVNGLPLKYVRKDTQNYLLYSIGWNGMDDGGVARKANEQGDWVWASDPTLIVNPDEEMRKAEEAAQAARGSTSSASTGKPMGGLKAREEAAKRNAEWQEAMEKRNAQFRTKEQINKRERAKAATGAGSK